MCHRTTRRPQVPRVSVAAGHGRVPRRPAHGVIRPLHCSPAAAGRCRGRGRCAVRLSSRLTHAAGPVGARHSGGDGGVWGGGGGRARGAGQCQHLAGCTAGELGCTPITENVSLCSCVYTLCARDRCTLLSCGARSWHVLTVMLCGGYAQSNVQGSSFSVLWKHCSTEVAWLLHAHSAMCTLLMALIAGNGPDDSIPLHPTPQVKWSLSFVGSAGSCEVVRGGPGAPTKLHVQHTHVKLQHTYKSYKCNIRICSAHVLLSSHCPSRASWLVACSNCCTHFGGHVLAGGSRAAYTLHVRGPGGDSDATSQQMGFSGTSREMGAFLALVRAVRSTMKRAGWPAIAAAV